MTNEIKKASCILLIGYDGRILTASRRDKFEDIALPGGKVDAGEESWETALRELREETGIILTKNDISKFYTGDCKSKVDCYSTDVFLCFEKDLGFMIKLIMPYQIEKGIEIKWSTWNEFLNKRNSFVDYNTYLYKYFASENNAWY